MTPPTPTPTASSNGVPAQPAVGDSVGGVDLSLVEHELCRIPEVQAARIVADHWGAPIEVHILATPGKHAKQVVRDVQSVALAAMGLDIDHRMVSVVQLPEEEVARAAAALDLVDEGAAAGDMGAEDDAHAARPNRVVVDSVFALRQGVRFSAEVTLSRADEVVTGRSEGLVAAAATHRIVAEATVDALRQVEPRAASAHVETASLTTLADRSVALASVVLVTPPNEEVVTGSAPVRSSGPHEALARAVLDALNRRLDGIS